MSEWSLKRFWTDAAAVQVDDGWTVQLDGRSVRTPSKALLVMPSQALADIVAAEWDAQVEAIDPNTMPFTRLANSAQDKVALQHNAVADMLAEYGGSDLLCYRADSPQKLIARQAAQWDPLLAWIASAEDIHLHVQTGLMPKEQSPAALARITELTRALPSPVLTGFHELVSLSGSWVAAYAILQSHRAAEDIWDAVHVDEFWQEEQWGEDEDALETRAIKRESFLIAERFIRACGGGPYGTLETAALYQELCAFDAVFA